MPEIPRTLSQIESYKGRRITIMGLGAFGGGVQAARFLAQRGADVTITDLRSEEQLAESLQQLADVPLHALFLNDHPESAFEGTELLIVNPAVKPDSRIVEECRRRGTIISSEIELFLHHNVGRVVAVTGSNGKSTTSALIYRLLKDNSALADRRIRLGGNIGTSLLPDVDNIRQTDLVILELSSFQLHQLRQSEFAPAVAVVTNFAVNHLDWHGSVDHYRAAKQVILRRQRRDDIAVLPDVFDEDIGAPVWRARGEHLRFGLRDQGEDGAFLEDGTLILRRGHFEDAVRLNVPALLPGDHNRLNVAAAGAAAWVAGADPNDFGSALGNFRPLEHRLQLVAQGRGLRFYNDSIATTPESAIAALRTFSQRCVILAGGADKGSDLTDFADVIQQRASGAVLLGQTAEQLEQLLDRFNQRPPVVPVRIANDFSDAFRAAVALAGQSGIVLLSPGCASFGWFRDFRERGEQFTKLAREWINA
ncbi:MAG: UDP-N-acetylmuramoyl-L-alanine--D-glutamate ligase [Planctomycetaceae bacterium]